MLVSFVRGGRLVGATNSHLDDGAAAFGCFSVKLKLWLEPVKTGEPTHWVWRLPAGVGCHTHTGSAGPLGPRSD